MPETLSPAGGGFLLEQGDPLRTFSPEDFTAEQRLIGQTAEEFLRNEVLPQVARIEQGDHALMHRLMQQAGTLGLLGADVPEVYGGLGLPQTTTALIAEKLNPQQSFALTHEAHTVIATLPLLFFGTHAQKQRYLPRLASGEWIASFALSEAGAGSDALALQTRAVLSPDGTHYRLTGEKMWITNAAFAQLFTVFARVDDRVTAFLVERDFPGVSFGKEEHKLGMHGTSTRRVILDNVPVPVQNALEVGRGHYAALCALNLGRFKLEAGAVGGLKYLLEVCTAYAQQRRTFGKPIAQHGLIQQKLATLCAQTFALESMIYRLAQDLDRVLAPIVPDAPDAPAHYHRAAEEFAIECNIVKIIGSEAYSTAADEAIQIHGGYGYTEEFPVARAWRDQRLLRIGEGANEIVRIAILSQILRRERAGRLPVRDAGLKATQALASATLPEPPLYADALDVIGSTAEDVRQLALFLLFQATERPDTDLLEMQEIAGAIADVICAAYALQSVRLRCQKLRIRDHPRYPVALLAGQVAALDCARIARTAACYALDSLPDMADPVDWRDEPFTGLSALLHRLDRSEESPLRLRRQLAAHVLEKGGYPL